jgi:hypothetical protein
MSRAAARLTELALILARLSAVGAIRRSRSCGDLDDLGAGILLLGCGHD